MLEIYQKYSTFGMEVKKIINEKKYNEMKLNKIN